MLKLLTLAAAVAAKGWETTSGCGKNPPTARGKTVSRKISINDPIMGETLDRKYDIDLPANYDPSKEYPVIFWFHWWGDNLDYQPYIDLGQKDGIITVYPEGMSDYRKQTNAGWTSWNIGDSGVTSTCTKDTWSYCYKSCQRLNSCGRCNAFTCYDDIYFVR